MTSAADRSPDVFLARCAETIGAERVLRAEADRAPYEVASTRATATSSAVRTSTISSDPPRPPALASRGVISCSGLNG